MSQFENLSAERDDVVGPTGAADEYIGVVCPGHGRKCRSRIIANPATGALEVRSDAGLEVERALNRAARRLKLQLCLTLLGLYFLKLRLDGSGIALKLHRYILGGGK
jgi:hypothetical protein